MVGNLGHRHRSFRSWRDGKKEESTGRTYNLQAISFRHLQGDGKETENVRTLPLPRTTLEQTPAAAAAKSLQSCPTLCDPIDGSPWGFPIPGILQARTLEWVAISFSNAWKWKVKVKSQSCPTLSDPMDCMWPTRLLRPWDFPGKSTGVGCHWSNRIKTTLVCQKQKGI